MKHLIIGNGEIGRALKEIFNCDIRDIESDLVGEYDVLHIAYPYSVFFDETVLNYKKKYKAKYVVVHSTVPVGTCAKIGAIHSPVTGVHPHLAESIKTFTKFVSDEVIADEFKKYGIPAVYVDDSRNTEAGKLYALLIYGINILIEKEIFNYCKVNGLNYDVVYKQFIKMYNDGYSIMNMPQFRMYDLTHREGSIGGHCVSQNAPLLNTEFAKILQSINSRNMI